MVSVSRLFRLTMVMIVALWVASMVPAATANEDGHEAGSDAHGHGAEPESHGDDGHTDDSEADAHGDGADAHGAEAGEAEGVVGPDQLGGESWSWTFDEPGMFMYHCHPHPWMTGMIDILPADGSAPQTHEVRVVEPDLVEEWAFSPDMLTIRVGDTVVWNNTGQVMHKIAEATGDHAAMHGGGGHADDVSASGSAPAAVHVDEHLADGALPTRFLPHPASPAGAVLGGIVSGVVVSGIVLVWMRRELS